MPYNDEAQDDGEITHNTALGILDAFCHLTFVSRSTTAQPGSPNDSDVYLIPSGATGTDWSGQDDLIGVYLDNDFYSGWYTNLANDFITPKVGMRAFVEDEDLFIMYDGTEWIPWDNHIRKSADTDRSSTTTTTDDPHLTAPVAASRKYTFEIMVFAIGHSSGDIKFAMSYPAGAVIAYAIAAVGGGGVDVLDDDSDSAVFALTGTPGSWPTDASAFFITGTLETDSNAGDLALQWAQGSSFATATTVKEGSYMTVDLTSE
jgi:hypothetical protein